MGATYTAAILFSPIFLGDKFTKMAALVRFGLRQGYKNLQRYTPITQQVCSIKTTKKQDEVVYPNLHPESKKYGVDDRTDKDEVRHVFIFNHDILNFKVGCFKNHF